jgi:hypothetical protein
MTWLLLLVLFAFLVILLIGGRRVWLVFAGSSLLRICGVVLFAANVFVSLTAVFGGITVSAGIDKFPAEWLTGTVFHSYLLPGLILSVVVGGSATVAAGAVLHSRKAGALSSMVAGVILLGWLAGERLILHPVAFSPQFWWLEAIYVASGFMMVVPAANVWWADPERRS